MGRFIGDDEFDEQLGRTLVAAATECADLGEAMATADRITPGDFNSWYQEWRRMGDQVSAEGEESLAGGHALDAAGCFLRASEYYRQAFFFARDDLDTPRLRDTYAAHRQAFRAALPLLAVDVTAVAIPYQDFFLQGYLCRPDASGLSRPTVICPAGYDSTAEAGYSFSAVAALRRDMNCLVYEGPGQGGVLYEQRRYLRPDYEVVLTAVLDWLVAQPGVDGRRLVPFGRSFAGYLVARGATREHRVAALVCDPVEYDFAATLRGRLGHGLWARLQADDPSLDAVFEALLADPHQRKGLVSRMVAHGTSSMRSYLRELSRFSIVGLADRITCPTLALEAEGDVANLGQLDSFVSALTCPVTTHRFTAAEGAGGHCEGLGQRRLERLAYGWIQSVLARDEEPEGEASIGFSRQ
jgi:Esterase FrsA-like